MKTPTQRVEENEKYDGMARGGGFSIARELAVELENLMKAIKTHSCNYKIGHPSVKSPCPLCELEKTFPEL